METCSVLEAPLIDLLDTSLRGLVPPESVELRGEWVRSVSKSYKSAAQLGTGSGPYVDVTNARWEGTLSCASEMSVIAFLAIAGEVFWVKVPVIAASLPVVVSLREYADYTFDTASFSASLAGGVLPSVVVASPTNLADVCAPTGSLLTGCAATIAHALSAAVILVALPRSVLKMQRNHLWRVRGPTALLIPSSIRTIFTHGRSGAFSIEPSLPDAGP